MKKRFLCLILATIMLSSLFIGCDGAGNVTTESVSANETEPGYESNTNNKDETENDETENDGTTETDGGIGCELPTEADPFEGLEGEVAPEFVKAQMTELLTNYGKIDYLWFDGCGSEGHEYDKKRIVAEMERLQPEMLTFCDPEWAQGIRWVGNEDGYASLNNPLVVSATDYSELPKEEQKLSHALFLPSECDCKIRATWFYVLNEDTLKSVDELFGMYEMSVGHGSNFLLNIGPDNRGLLPDADAKRLLELGERNTIDVYTLNRSISRTHLK